MRRALLAASIVLVAACAPGLVPPEHQPEVPAPVVAPTPPTASSSEPDLPATVTEAGATAERVLFLATHLKTGELRAHCPLGVPDAARVRCLVELRYEDQPDERALAVTLFTETGSLAGLLPEETSDQGPWGKLHLMPARPINENRRQLEWIIDAMRAHGRFLDGLREQTTIAFRDRPIDFRFFYAENAKHPSAFAVSRNIAWNVRGALSVSAEAVDGVLFHGTFHLNDGWHGEGNEHPWSETHLAAVYARIQDKCRGKRNGCLADFAPTDTRLKGSFYAFSGDGPREYAAEVAVRYYREESRALRGEALPGPAFRCLAPENAEAIAAVAQEFFGGRDDAPACALP